MKQVSAQQVVAPPVTSAPAAAPSAPIVLPDVTVEAPAKRNIKKTQMKRGSPQAASRPARAQQAASAPSSGASGTTLNPQVIEGEKIVRTLRDTTTSVGVITGKDIAERQIGDVKEAIEQTANALTSDKSTGFVVRGLNSEGQTGLQHITGVPLIGVVIDGATQNPDAVRRGARGLWDVDQVEVLRGPQSTLQGRNSLGGAVYVKTNDPTYTPGVIVEGTVGSNNLKAGGFVINTPIVAGQSAFRISGYKSSSDHGISYADPTNELMGENGFSVLRGKLLLEPESTPGLSALFTVSRTIDKPGAAMVSGPDFFERKFGYTSAFTDFRDATANNYVADVSYDVMPGLTVRSVTAYAQTETLIKTAAGAAFQREGDNTNGKDFTQDLRLEIDNKGNGISGVLGLFYGSFRRDNVSNQFAYLPYFFPGSPDMTIPYYNGSIGAKTNSMAAYADLRYRLNQWAFIAGGRLLRDEVSSYENSTLLDTNTFTYVYADDRYEASFNEFLPKVGVSYDVTSNQTVGITYNKGYRTGFQRRGADNKLVTVAPEYLDAYELSYRSNWLRKTFDLNANVFYYNYQDQQIAVLNEVYGVAEIFNAGKSHAYGAEIEARWRPIPPLQIFANLGFLKTEFDEMVYQGVDRSGNEYPQAPSYTFAAGAMYHSPRGWFAGANLRHTDGYYTNGDITNDKARFGVSGYTVVDARVGWEWENYKLTLFAKNLFDEKYVTGVDRQDMPPLSPSYAYVGEERTFGVTLTGKF